MCNLFFLFCRKYFIYFNLYLLVQYQSGTFLDFINDDSVKDNNNSKINKNDVHDNTPIKKDYEYYKNKTNELENKINELEKKIKK